jgi:hypothetical protein
MDNLLKLLAEVENRPEVYIGCKNIRFLSHFLSGYCMARVEESPEYGNWLFGDFREFLAKKYQDNRSFDWASLIIEHEIDGNSTDAFFRLLHEYLEHHIV